MNEVLGGTHMNRFGIAWVNNYHDRALSLLMSRDAATGFSLSLGAGRAFADLEDDQVNESMFERKNGASAFIERANIFYYSGHATERSIVLGVAVGGDGLVKPEELRLGGLLAYAVFDSCSLLDLDFQDFWANAFAGLHYMLGFSGQTIQDLTRGHRFAEYLNQGRPMTIPEAWRRATIETVPPPVVPWCFLRAIHQGMSLADEAWSNILPLAAAPRVPFAFISRTEQSQPSSGSRVAEQPGLVKLFRTPSSALTDEGLRELAAKFGLDNHISRSGPGWRELHNADSVLHLYDQAGSFWWSQSPTPLMELFHAPQPAPPLSVAIESARDYLRRKQLDDPRLIPQPSSWTVETQREHRPDGHGDGLLLKRTIAQHANFGFALDGLPVVGPGAKLRVSFEGRAVSEVFRFWREPLEDGTVEINLTPEEAKAKVISSTEFAQLPRGAVTFEGEPQLGYYARPVGLQQAALVPVYEIHGVVSTEVLPRYEFTRFVSVAPNSLELQLPELI